MKRFLTAALCLGIIGISTAGTVDAAKIPNSAGNDATSAIKVEKLNLTKDWDKVFPKSDRVNHRKVTFVNRYGITLAADLYEPKNYSGKLAAIAVSGPFGAVKEQSSGLYAQEMAERGFLTIAFDPSYTGESGGTPRFVTSPDINTEDFCAAVDYLSTLDNVDADRIGIIGVCGWGSMAINAAAIDTRIKATVTTTMYDMSRVTANGYFDYDKDESTIKAERAQNRRNLNAQRTADYKAGRYARAGGVVEDPSEFPQFAKDYYAYYKTERGYHKRSPNSNAGWNVTGMMSLMNMPLLRYADEIETPVLIIHGEKAHSRYFSEDAFDQITGKRHPRGSRNVVVGNKELMIIPGASHIDLYDNFDAIPFDKIENFFDENL